ncbi:TetR/AcrR family transcriptional regulator [Rhizobium puerariae]|uniref:TetR/AcrR family transcriptional regulator n=1 Tax=Rhizobium puerariae TaxID=1585791 RepID=A0ABV6AQQ9_9HYPH
MNKKMDARLPRDRVLEVAARLFAEQGIDAVSVRDITGAAGVNLGTINYHFGSKENLIHEVFETLLAPLQERRLALLDQIEAQAGDGPLDLELVLRAIVEPTIRSSIGQEGAVVYLPRLMFQVYAVARPFLGEKNSELNDRVAKRFIDAISRAAPGVPYEQVCWRYYMVVGGFLQLVSDALGSNRLHRLSDGCCDTGDPNRVIEELITFFMQGMTAPAGSLRQDAFNNPGREAFLEALASPF